MCTKGRNLTFKIVYSTGLGGSQKNTETENRHEETRQNRSSASGGLRAIVISACDTLLTYTALLKMALVNINEGLKEKYSRDKTFSAEYHFSCVRQIAHTDRFARVLTRACAITRVKRKGLCNYDDNSNNDDYNNDDDNNDDNVLSIGLP